MDALEALATRHGVLRFKPKPVEPDKIRAMLEAAIAAPSPANLQPWAFVVVTEPSLTRHIAHYLIQVQEQQVFRALLDMPDDITVKLMRLYESFDQTPCFVLVCLDPKADFAQPQHQAVLRDWYLVCLGAAMENLMTAATALGLGTRWFGGLALDGGGQPLKDLLGIPPEVEIVSITPVGYHDEPPKERPAQELLDVAGFKRGDSLALTRLLRGKLPLEQVLHHNRW